MPRYQFSAIDSKGRAKKGTINAVNELAAAEAIAKHGLTANEISLIASASADTVFSDEEDKNTGEIIETTTQKRRNQSILPLLISLLALCFALGSLVVVFFRDPLGHGLSAYDFSSPEAAVKSQMEILEKSDFRALIELQRHKAGELKQSIKTLEISRVADWQDKKICFVAYLERGRKKKEIESFEKDLETKLWLPIFVSRFDVEKTDPKLAKEMEVTVHSPSN
ncbi:MAG TPA: hypothetical protein VGJ05_02610 [Fimbriiglobus sp.]|jgi:hypothetical protein